MISGEVNQQSEATIPITLIDAVGAQHVVTAVIDTGFAGELTLPPQTIRNMGLQWLGRQRMILGDGTQPMFDVYQARLIWDGIERRVEAELAAMTPLVGMKLLRDHELTMQIAPGGKVHLQKLTST